MKDKILRILKTKGFYTLIGAILAATGFVAGPAIVSVVDDPIIEIVESISE